MKTGNSLIQSQGDQKASSTGKATVNKYWGRFQEALAREVDFGERLPQGMPNFVVDYLQKLMYWAMDSAEAQVKDRSAVLERQETRFMERKAQLEDSLEQANESTSVSSGHQGS